jgi:hypothetical protein
MMHTQIFATGVFLSPIKIDNKWHWIVDEFEDDCFENGIYIEVTEVADTEEGLKHGVE